MKKLILWIVIAVVVMIALVVTGVFLFLDRGVQHAVEKVGPMVTKVSVKVGGVSLSPLSGSGQVKGLVLGNPEGFKTPFAMSVGSSRLAVAPGSIFSDKVVVRSIVVEAPEISYETDLKSSNLGKIQANVEAFMGPADTNAPAREAGPTKKLQVDEFKVTGGKIHVSVTALGGKTVTVPLPEIDLKNLGQGPEGITAPELTKVFLNQVITEAVKAAGPAVKDLGKQLGDAAAGAAKDAVQGATKSVTDLFKKKEK